MSFGEKGLEGPGQKRGRNSLVFLSAEREEQQKA